MKIKSESPSWLVSCTKIFIWVYWLLWQTESLRHRSLRHSNFPSSSINVKTEWSLLFFACFKFPSCAWAAVSTHYLCWIDCFHQQSASLGIFWAVVSNSIKPPSHGPSWSLAHYSNHKDKWQLLSLSLSSYESCCRYFEDEKKYFFITLASNNATS